MIIGIVIDCALNLLYRQRGIDGTELSKDLERLHISPINQGYGRDRRPSLFETSDGRLVLPRPMVYSYDPWGQYRCRISQPHPLLRFPTPAHIYGFNGF